MTIKPPFFRCSISVYSRADKRTDHGPTSNIKTQSGADTAAHLSYITGHKLISGFDNLPRQSNKDPDRIDEVAIFGWDGMKSQVATKEALQQITIEVDKMDRRKNSRVLREAKLSLPRGFTPQEHSQIVARVSRRLNERYKTPIISAIHLDRKDHNPHAHISFPTRFLESNKTSFGKKIRQLDDRKTGPKEIEFIRSVCAEEINIVLHKTKSQTADTRQVSNLSYLRQKLNLEPKISVNRRSATNHQVLEYNQLIDSLHFKRQKHNILIELHSAHKKAIQKHSAQALRKMNKTRFMLHLSSSNPLTCIGYLLSWGISSLYKDAQTLTKTQEEKKKVKGRREELQLQRQSEKQHREMQRTDRIALRLERMSLSKIKHRKI